MIDLASYLNNTGRADRVSGGERMIPVSTSKGDFRVWIKRVGNNPRLKMLLLHGGPAATHEYLIAFDVLPWPTRNTSRAWSSRT